MTVGVSRPGESVTSCGYQLDNTSLNWQVSSDCPAVVVPWSGRIAQSPIQQHGVRQESVAVGQDDLNVAIDRCLCILGPEDDGQPIVTVRLIWVGRHHDVAALDLLAESRTLRP